MVVQKANLKFRPVVKVCTPRHYCPLSPHTHYSNIVMEKSKREIVLVLIESIILIASKICLPNSSSSPVFSFWKSLRIAPDLQHSWETALPQEMCPEFSGSFPARLEFQESHGIPTQFQYKAGSFEVDSADHLSRAVR